MTEFTKEAFLEVLHALTTKDLKFPKDFPAGDAFVKRGELCSGIFSGGVQLLMTFPNKHISLLMSYVWDVFHHRHALMALGPKVPSLSISAAKDSTGHTRIIVIPPHDWPEAVEKDTLFQLGAVLFISSQVADVYNDRIISKESRSVMIKLATSYEAEYLHIVKQMGHNDFNEYQQNVMNEFPEGIDSSLLYVRKPVDIVN
jgi:hypothetical protein